MIPIAKPWIDKEEEQAVVNVLRSGNIAQGKVVEDFENQFANYIGTKYAIAVNSGTAALQIALMSAGIKPGDEVITSPFSFIATANSILFCGAKPVFVDIDEETYNINPDLIKEKITNKTKAILPIHLYGNPCKMDELMEISKKHSLFIIEDAAQAHGAEYQSKKVGSIGDAGCFSFYATKNMTTSEGGMITTNSKDIFEKARLIRNHGSLIRYYHQILGYNFRMTEICAAIGIEQLKKLDKFNKVRVSNATFLSSKLEGKYAIPKITNNSSHVFHQYTIGTKNRAEVIKRLEFGQIGYAIFYPLPIHKQEFYQNLGYRDNLPISERSSNEVLSLPVHPKLSQEDLDHIVKIII